MPYKPDKREYRSAGALVPKDDEKTLILRGTPIVLERPAVIFEEGGVQYREVIDRDALTGCDLSDFILNRNHGEADCTVYARTRNRSLRYTVTENGMEIEAFLDGEDERHRALFRDVQSGRVDKMSFSFTVAEDSYDRETRTRRILKIKKIYDVSAVDFAAYNDTGIKAARDFFSMEREKERQELARYRRRILTLKTYF